MYHHKKNLFLKELFPTQFNTIPSIIIWTIVFLIDVAIVFGLAHLLGIPLPVGGNLWGKIGVTVYLVVAFALFCLESFVYTKIVQHRQIEP